MSIGEIFHEETNNWPDRRDSARRLEFTREPADNRPITFKEYAGLDSVELPLDALSRRTRSGVEVLSRGSEGNAQLDASGLSRILAFSAGITRVIDTGMFIRYCRAASSAHSYPDVYVVCGDLAGIPAGAYHFHGLHLRLDRLRAGDFRAALAKIAADPSIARRPATVILAGVPWRAAWRYAERALRHVYWDCGGLLANMTAVADADGVASRIVLGFVDADVAALLGLDHVNEFPVALATFGTESSTAPASPALTAMDIVAPALTTGTPVRFPLIEEAHHGGDLADSAGVLVWRNARAAAGTAASAWEGSAPSARRTIEETILRRGSTRRLRLEAVPRAQLDWVVSAGIRPPHGDWLDPGRTLLEHYVLLFAVEGMRPGLYRVGSHGLDLLREQDLREQGRFLSLRQPQGGDGAYTTFHFADLARITRSLGARGYRAAQVQGGYVLERLHLAAFAVGLGATGLTFFDDAVQKACGTNAAVMSEVAVGRPFYRAKRGGLGEGATTITGRAFDFVRQRMKELDQPRPAAP